MGFFLKIFIFIHVYIDYSIDWIWSLYFNRLKQKVPRITNPLISESAVSLAKKIKNRELKSAELVKAYIRRIEDVNSVLNAVVDTRFKEALEEAKEIDNNIENGIYSEEDFNRKPFLGIPFTSKESTACKGLKWTFGLLSRRYILADEDADIVRLMKNAGGILLGVTNIPQLNLWVESFNPVYGRTNNPYDTTRNVGGSSGGEACIISACGSAIGLGTDIGGSIRIPAFMCGIFGHKPTHNLISTKGMTFRKGGDESTMVSAGPMARHSEDLIPLLKVLLGENVKRLKLDTPVDKVRVFYLKDFKSPLASKVRPEMEKILLKVVQKLEDISIEKPKCVEFEGTRYTNALWNFWMKKEPGFDFQSDITNRKSRLTLFSMLRHLLFLTGEYSLTVLYGLINFSIFPPKNQVWAKETTETLRNEIITCLGDDGVLLCPSGPWPASQHYTSFLRPFNVAYTSLWNLLKLPATQVPVGLDKEGLPFGVQVIASPYNDHLTLSVAKHIEESLGGWVPPGEFKKKL